MRRATIAALVTMLVVGVTGCAPDYFFVVKRIGHDQETGRHYLVCGPAHGEGQVEITLSEYRSRQWSVGERCLDFQVEAGTPVSTATTQAPTT